MVRFQEEVTEGTPGMATNFLNQLVTFYPEHYPELFARAMLRHEQSAYDVDVLSILRVDTIPAHFRGENPPAWLSDVREKIQEAPKRKILTLEEGVELSSLLPSNEDRGEVTADQVMGDIAVIIGDEDNIGFSTELYKHGLVGAGDVIVDIDLDRTSETADVLVDVHDGTVSRIAPLHMNFAADPESLSMDTLFPGKIPDEARAAYRNLIVEVLRIKAEKIRKQQQHTAKRRAQAVPEDKDTEIRSGIESPGLTREQRIERYEVQKLASTHRKRRSASEHVHRAPEPGEVFVAATSEASIGLTVLGLERDIVAGLLADEKISSVPADTLVRKLDHLVDMAAISQKMFGKRVNLDSVGADAEGINLRQINLVFDDRHTALRVYVEDIGGGEFQLRGIMAKKGDKQQSRYIRGLTQKIIDERSDAAMTHNGL
jgi:hypothetical protein